MHTIQILGYRTHHFTTEHANEIAMNTHWTLLGTVTGNESGTCCTYRWPPLSGSCIVPSLRPAVKQSIQN